MSAEFWAIIGVGVALAGLQWRMYASLSTGLNGRMDRMEARLDRIEADLTSVKERLSRLEGQVELLLRGLQSRLAAARRKGGEHLPFCLFFRACHPKPAGGVGLGQAARRGMDGNAVEGLDDGGEDAAHLVAFGLLSQRKQPLVGVFAGRPGDRDGYGGGCVGGDL